MIENSNGYKILLNSKLDDEICKRKNGETLEEHLRKVGFGKWIFYTDLEIAEEIFKDLVYLVSKGKILAIKYSTNYFRNLEYSNGKSIFCVYAEDKNQIETINLLTDILEKKEKYDSITEFNWKYDAEMMDYENFGKNRNTVIID